MRLVLVSVFILFSSIAYGHDPDTGEANWITNPIYMGRDGVHCCGIRDCDRLNPEHVKATPAGYVLLDFKNELVPYDQATPSEDGKFWRCHSYTGERRCFFAPTGTQ